MRFGLPFTFTGQLRESCTCSGAPGKDLRHPRANGYHLLSCSRGGQASAGHARMTQVVVGWLHRELPHLRVKYEPPLLSGTERNGDHHSRGDLGIYDFSTTNKHFILDFTTIQNFPKAKWTKGRSGILVLAALREREKHARYDELAQRNGATFVPFVIEMAGGLGAEATGFLKTLQEELERHGHSAANAKRRVQNLQFEFVTQQRKAYVNCVIRRARELQRRTPAPHVGGLDA